MTEPIFEQMIHHGEQDIDGIRRVWNDITRHAHRQPYDSRNDLKGPSMSALLDVEAKFKEFAADVTAKLNDLSENAAPVIHDGAEVIERLSKSPIVGQLEQLTEDLDPALEAAIVAIIKTAGDAASKVAAATAPAAPVESAPPVDPQIQTGVAA